VQEQAFIARSPNEAVIADAQSRVKDRPRANWKFFHHPEEWQVDAQGELVPVLSQMSMAPGAGAEPNGDFTPQQRRLEAKGWRGIPHDVLRELGIKDYVVAYVNHRGKDVCRSVFQTPYTDGTGNTGWKIDTEAMAAFIELLRKKGAIPAPRPRIVQQLLDRERGRHQFLADRRPDERNAPAVARHTMKVMACERAMAKLEAELENSIRIYGREAAPVRSALLGALRQATLQEQAEQEAVASLGHKLGRAAAAIEEPTPSKRARSRRKAEAELEVPAPLQLAPTPPPTDPGGFTASGPADDLDEDDDE
jgi:hypothetical protein